MSSLPRVFYFSMINTDESNRKLRLDTYIGAASGKVRSVVGALRVSGLRGWIVSVPVVVTQRGKVGGTRPILVRAKRGPALFLRSHRNRWVRKILAFWLFGAFAVRYVRPVDRVILYNHSFEYLLALIVLRLRGNPAVLDVEDAPRRDEVGLRPTVDRLVFPLFLCLTKETKIVASKSMGRRLNLPDPAVISGVAAIELREQGTCWKGAGLTADSPIRIAYGGTIEVSTGLDLFCGCLPILEDILRSRGRFVEFVVTGPRCCPRITEIARTSGFHHIGLAEYYAINRQDYLSVMRSCHAGLSLRIPGSSLAEMTFPSKVIELTSHGLLVISLPSDDLLSVFSAEEVAFIPRPTAGALAQGIARIACEPEFFRQVAARGERICHETFSEENVGASLVGVLYGAARSRQP